MKGDNHVISNAEVEVEQKILRKKYGMREVEPKRLNCLRCDQAFDSVDKAANRLCENCRKVLKSISL